MAKSNHGPKPSLMLRERERESWENSSDRSSAFTAGGNLCTLHDGHQLRDSFSSSLEERDDMNVFALWQMEHILHLPSSGGIL